MKVLNKQLVKRILTLVKSKGLYGSELSKTIQKESQEIDSGIIYLTVKTLNDHGIIVSYLNMEGNAEAFKVKYKLTKKGNVLYDAMEKGKI